MTKHYHLGRSGLRVSRLCLGALTFGENTFDGSWGADAATSRSLFDCYLDHGGNFIDTADVYTLGESEALLGQFIEESKSRHRMVLTTKYTMSSLPGSPAHAGNGRKNMMRAVEESLRRLRTDYIDLYTMHVWDRITPADEVVRGFDDLIRQGKVLYAGLSDVPAWYAARAQTYAETHALAPITCLQLPYSLVERSLEQEHSALALALGIAVTAWSPLGMGILSGKYHESGAGISGKGRLNSTRRENVLGYFTSRNFAIAEELRRVAQEVGRSCAQVAINWVANRPAVASVIVGASKLVQLEDNLASLDFDLPPELRRRLDEASAPGDGSPYSMFYDSFQRDTVNAGSPVDDKPSHYYDHPFRA
jgi:aryl-alcohol dehydrogenase-like predicted oxidoreductase